MRTGFNRIEAPGSRARRQAFSLVELVAVILIFAVLLALLVGGYRFVYQTGKRAACLNNLRQVGSALHLYLGEHDNRFFSLDDVKAKSWIAMLVPYTKESKKAFRCPAAPYDPLKAERTYRFNVTRGGGFPNFPDRPEYAMLGKNVAMVVLPSRTVAIVDEPLYISMDPKQVVLPFAANNSVLWWAQLDTPESRLHGFHGTKLANFLFVDGHVESIPRPVPFEFYDYLSQNK